MQKLFFIFFILLASCQQDELIEVEEKGNLKLDISFDRPQTNGRTGIYEFQLLIGVDMSL